MLGTFPTTISRVNLPDLARQALSRRPRSSNDLRVSTAEPPPRDSVARDLNRPKPERALTFHDSASYFAVCFFYALGPSLIDIFQSPMTKQIVRDLLLRQGWTVDGHFQAYLYALTLSAYPFAKCGASPFMGHLSDRIGRRHTLTCTLVVTGLCLLLTGYCTTWTSLIVCRFLTGLFANGGLLTAYAADVAASSIADRTTLFSYFITAWAFARVAAAWLFTRLGESVRVCCVSAALCEFLAALITAYISTDRAEVKPVGQTAPQPNAAASSPRRDGDASPSRLPRSLSNGSLARLHSQVFHDRPSFRRAFREMLNDPLMAPLFVASLLTPRIDVAAFLWQRFRQGPSSVGYIKAVESVTVILVPLTPAIPVLTRRLGYSGASVACSVLMALCWIGITNVHSMKELYVMVMLRSAISTIYEPSIKSIIMNSARARKKEQIGSFSGIQQSMKGMAQVMGSFWGSFLASYSANVPVTLSAGVNIANAFIIYNCVNVAVEGAGGGPVPSSRGSSGGLTRSSTSATLAGRSQIQADAAAGPERVPESVEQLAAEPKKDR